MWFWWVLLKIGVRLGQVLGSLRVAVEFGPINGRAG